MRAWRRGGTPDPDALMCEQRERMAYLAVTDHEYMGHVRVLIASNASDQTLLPSISDATGWAEWALERRSDLLREAPEAYRALVRPRARVLGIIHPDDFAPDQQPDLTDITPEGWQHL